MDSRGRAVESAFVIGVSAAQHLRDACRFGEIAKSARYKSIEMAEAETKRDRSIEAACLAEEHVLSTTPSSARDRAAIAVAGFSVMSRLVGHDTLDGDEDAARQARAALRGFAALANAAPKDVLDQLCEPTTRALIDALADGLGAEHCQESALLLSV